MVIAWNVGNSVRGQGASANPRHAMQKEMKKTFSLLFVSTKYLCRKRQKVADILFPPFCFAFLCLSSLLPHPPCPSSFQRFCPLYRRKFWVNSEQRIPDRLELPAAKGLETLGSLRPKPPASSSSLVTALCSGFISLTHRRAIQKQSSQTRRKDA